MIELESIKKFYQIGKHSNLVLKNLNLKIKKGDFVSIVGPSGSGKSTLLHIMSGMDKPSSGKVIINNQNLHNLKDSKIAKIRNQKMGFVYQDFHLLEHLTVRENVEIPLLINKSKLSEQDQQKITETLDSLGILAQENQKPNQVSGGQKQRAAIARAIIMAPDIIFADEPTGNLDSQTGSEIIELLKKIQKNHNITMIVITHDQNIAKNADHIVEIKDGEIPNSAHPKNYLQ
ncbi:ATP-binding cassette domain-containing protein [Candidatus Peregrinibacteria bacterium]|nr:ATP-binding cassette domain-containing protein [Candidatus Peregrinibacteria bacterium]